VKKNVKNKAEEGAKTAKWCGTTMGGKSKKCLPKKISVF